jgi:hypothetical protein
MQAIDERGKFSLARSQGIEDQVLLDTFMRVASFVASWKAVSLEKYPPTNNQQRHLQKSNGITADRHLTEETLHLPC